MNIHDHPKQDELALLRDSADAFVNRRMDHKRTRSLRETLPGYDPAIVREMAELGWFGILVPEQFEGLGLGFAEMSVVLQRAGRGLLGEPLVAAAVLAAQTLRHSGNVAVQGRLLPALANASELIALAWQEPEGGIALTEPKAVAVGNTSSAKLNGRKRFVAGGSAAAGFLITARTSDGVGLYLVPRNTRGLTIENEWRADGTASTILSLQDVAGAELVAVGASAEAALIRAFDETIVMAAAELFGILVETQARTLDYLKTRVQFDKPIGSFQALQHRAVDLYILQEISESVLGEAVGVLDAAESTPAERSLVASRAKARLSDATLQVTRAAVQLHGAIGFTEECDIGLYLKRAHVLAAWLGNANVHRRRFMQLEAPFAAA